jgi:hypothetical protein
MPPPAISFVIDIERCYAADIFAFDADTPYAAEPLLPLSPLPLIFASFHVIFIFTPISALLRHYYAIFR